MSTTDDPPPARSIPTSRPLWPAVALAWAGLLGTGLLAGGLVALGGVAAWTAEAHQGGILAAVALGGVLGCLALLAACWWPLARRFTPGRGWPAVVATLATAVLLPVMTGIAVMTTTVVYAPVACRDDPNPGCGYGVVLWVPTIGAVVPWTLAGLPWLFLLCVGASRTRYREDSGR